MNRFLLKDNEIMIFTDFNNTLVDFENEYNFVANVYDEFKLYSSQILKANLTKCLNLFEERTGLTPVICVVTNASAFAVDSNNYFGICQDLNMTFFNHQNQTDAHKKRIYENSCERFFRYLIYRENDFFFEINPLATSIEDMFIAREFSEKTKQIKMIPQFKKKESVARMLTLLDPNRDRLPRAIFAGDSIKDDYPMKLTETYQGTSKIFIRPGNAKIFKPSLIYEFCTAKGYEFSSIHPKTGKKIRCFDNNTIRFLNDADRAAFDLFDDGDMIFLTSKNSKGLIEGIYQAMEVFSQGTSQKQIIY